MFDNLLSIFGKSGFAAISSVGNDYKVSAGNKVLTVSAKGANISVVNDSAKSEIVLPAKYSMLVLSAISRAISSIGVKKWSKSVSKVMAKLPSVKPATAAVLVPVACAKNAVIFKDVLSRHFIVRMPAVQAIARWAKLRARSADYLMLDEAELLNGEPSEIEGLLSGFESGAEAFGEEIKDEVIDLDRIEITIGIDPDADEGQQIADVVINTPYSDVGDTAVLALTPDGEIDLEHLTEVDELGSEEVLEAFSQRAIPSRFAVAYSAHAFSYIYTLMGSKKAEACSKIFRSAIAGLKTGANMTPSVSSVKVAPFPKLVVSNKRGIYRFALSEDEVMVDDGVEVVDEFEEAVEDVAVEDISVDVEAVGDAIAELVEVLELPAEVVEEIKSEVSEEEPSEWIDVEDGTEAEIEIGEAGDVEEEVAESRRLVKALLALSKDSKIRKAVVSRLKTLKALRSAESSITTSVIGGKLLMALSEVQSTDSETGNAVIAEEVEKILEEAHIEIKGDTEGNKEEKVESKKAFSKFIKRLLAMKAVSANMRKYKAEPLFQSSSKSALSYAVSDINNYVKLSALSGSYAMEVIKEAKVARSSVKQSLALSMMSSNTAVSRFVLTSADVDSNTVLSRVVSSLSFSALSAGISQDRMLKSFEGNLKELNSALSSVKEVVGSSLRPVESRKLARNGKYAFSFLYRGKPVLLNAERAASGKLSFSFRSDVREFPALSRLGASLIGKGILKVALNNAKIEEKKQRAASAGMPASAPVNAPIQMDFFKEPFSLETFDDPRAAIYALSEVTVDIDSEAAELFAHLDDESLNEKDILIKLEDKEEEFFESEAETVNEMGETMLDIVESRKFTRAFSFLKSKGVKSSKVSALVKSCLAKKESIKRGRLTMQRLGKSFKFAEFSAKAKSSIYEKMELPFDINGKKGVLTINGRFFAQKPRVLRQVLAEAFENNGDDLLGVVDDVSLYLEDDGMFEDLRISGDNREAVAFDYSDFVASVSLEGGGASSRKSVRSSKYALRRKARSAQNPSKDLERLIRKALLLSSSDGGTAVHNALEPIYRIMRDSYPKSKSVSALLDLLNAPSISGIDTKAPLPLKEIKTVLESILKELSLAQSCKVLNRKQRRAFSKSGVVDWSKVYVKPANTGMMSAEDFMMQGLTDKEFSDLYGGVFSWELMNSSIEAYERSGNSVSFCDADGVCGYLNADGSITPYEGANQSVLRKSRSYIENEVSVGFRLVQFSEDVITENYKEDNGGKEPPTSFWDSILEAETKEWLNFKKQIESKVPAVIVTEYGYNDDALEVSVVFDSKYTKEMGAFLKSLGSILDEDNGSNNVYVSYYEINSEANLVGDEVYGSLDRMEVFVDKTPSNMPLIKELGYGSAEQRRKSSQQRLGKANSNGSDTSWIIKGDSVAVKDAYAEGGGDVLDDVIAECQDRLERIVPAGATFNVTDYGGIIIEGEGEDTLTTVLDALEPYDVSKNGTRAVSFIGGEMLDDLYGVYTLKVSDASWLSYFKGFVKSAGSRKARSSQRSSGTVKSVRSLFAKSLSRRRPAKSYNNPGDGWELFIHDLRMEFLIDGDADVYDPEIDDYIYHGDERYNDLNFAEQERLEAAGEDTARRLQKMFKGVTVSYHPGGGMQVPNWDIRGNDVEMLKKVVDYLEPYDVREHRGRIVFRSDFGGDSLGVGIEVFVSEDIEEDATYKGLFSGVAASRRQAPPRLGKAHNSRIEGFNRGRQ